MQTTRNGLLTKQQQEGKTMTTITGGAGNDTIVGDLFDNYIDGWSGDDNIYGEGGNDTLLGYTGNDYIDGWTGDDSIYGESGNDTLLGYTGYDFLSGGSGDDSLFGESGHDTLLGGSGSDTLVGGSGSDYIDGYGGYAYEYDVLTGEGSGSAPGVNSSGYDGADTFVLGDVFGAYYQGAGYATITDFFWAEGDTIQVHGSASDYSLGFQDWSGSSATDTLIYYQNDLIGVVQDTTNVFTSADFTYV